MGDVLEEGLLFLLRFLQFGSHPVHGFSQLPEFHVAEIYFPRCQIPAADLRSKIGQILYRFGERTGEAPA